VAGHGGVGHLLMIPMVARDLLAAIVGIVQAFSRAPMAINMVALLASIPAVTTISPVAFQASLPAAATINLVKVLASMKGSIALHQGVVTVLGAGVLPRLWESPTGKMLSSRSDLASRMVTKGSRWSWFPNQIIVISLWAFEQRMFWNFADLG